MGRSGTVGAKRRPPSWSAVDARDMFRRGGPKASRVDPAGASSRGIARSGHRHTHPSKEGRSKTTCPSKGVEDGGAYPSEEGSDAGGRIDRKEAATEATTTMTPSGASRRSASDGAGGVVHPDGSLASHPRLAAKLRALCDAWSVPFGAHPNHMSVAVYRPALSSFELLRARGKHFNKFGRNEGPRTFLLPEEALFLAETERLAVLAPHGGGPPLSLRAVRRLAVNGRDGGIRNAALALRPEWYAVFAHLARKGYVVRRFGSPWTSGRTRPATASAGPAGTARRIGSASHRRREGGEKEGEEEEGEGGEDGDGDRDGEGDEGRRAAVRIDEDVKRPAGGGAMRGAEGVGSGWWLDARDPAHGWLGDTEAVRLAEALVTARYAPAPRPPPREPLFRVYLPNGNFSKRQPDPVHFFVFYCEEGEVPDATEVEASAATATASLELEGGAAGGGGGTHRHVFATVVDGTVMMFGMNACE